MRARQFWLMPFRNADGGAGGGGAPDSGAAIAAPDLVRAAIEGAAPNEQPPAKDSTPPAKDGAPPADGAASYWPEGLPETFAGFKGQTDRETIDKLTGELKGQPRAPEKPDDYKLALPEEFTKRFGDLSKDEVLPIWRQVAHKNGLTDQQFNGAISELYGEMLTKGLIEEPIDVGAELEKLAPKSGDPVSRKAQASARINGVANNVNGMVTRGVLSRTEGNMVLALAARAEGVVALEKLFKAAGEHGL
jgi:hypothetical protein